MNKTPEQYELNVKTLRQFEETFAQIKTEVTLKDPWEGMSFAMDALAKDLKPGQVVKTITRAWKANNSCDSKLIVIGTPAGPLCLYQVTQGSSSGQPSVEERTFIQPHIPGGIYGLLKHRMGNPIGPEDLAWLLDPQVPDAKNIGLDLYYLMQNLTPNDSTKGVEVGAWLDAALKP